MSALWLPSYANDADYRPRAPVILLPPRRRPIHCDRCGRFIRGDMDTAQRCAECGRKLCDYCLELQCEGGHDTRGWTSDEEPTAPLSLLNF